MESKEDKNKIKSCLYITSTPIGNLKDINLRVIEVLSKSDVILCEDTRISKKLLNTYKIYAKTISYHKFNEKKFRKIIEILKGGKIISLISDAGTPTISDPGQILIRRCIDENVCIIPIPGPQLLLLHYLFQDLKIDFIFTDLYLRPITQLKKNLNY